MGVKNVLLVIILVVSLILVHNLYVNYSYENCMKEYETNKDLKCWKMKRLDN